jgi:hypothetical protein
MSKQISRKERIKILKNLIRIEKRIDYKHQKIKFDKLKNFAYRNPSVYEHLSISEGPKKFRLCWCAEAGKIADFITQDIFLPCEGNKNIEQIKTFIFTDEEYCFEEEPVGYSSDHFQKVLSYRNEKLYEGYPAEIFGFESMVYFPGKEICCIFVKAGTDKFETHPLFLLGIDLVCWILPDIPEGAEGIALFPPQPPFEIDFCGAEFCLGDLEDHWPIEESNSETYNIRGRSYQIKRIIQQ